MADNPEDDFLASSAPVPAPRPTDPNADYVYGIPDVQEMGIGAQFLNMFAPYRSRVVEPSTTEYIPLEELGMDAIKGEVMRKFTPGQYAEPEFGFSYMPAVQGVASFFSDPVESAKAAGQAIMDIPEQQMLGAEAMMLGYDFAYDPETGQEYRYDPTLIPATTAVGTAISIAREGPGGQVLGIMAGRNAHDGDRKFQQFTEAKDKGLDERAVYAETKGYIEPSDNAFRFEIDTSNATLNKDYFEDSDLEDVADGAPYQRFQFEEFTKKEGRPPTLGDLMEFKELYYQYPELSDIEIKRVPLGMFNTKAAYDPIDNVIYISSAGPRQMVSNLLHEVQHAVQHAEGHVTGSGVRQYLPEGFDERRRIQSDQVNRSAAFYADKLEKQAKKKGIDANLYKYNMARKAKLYFDGDPKAYGYEDLSKYATVADLQDLRLLADDFEKLEAMDAEVIKAGKMYFRQPGEVEARTAQTKYIEDRQGEFPLDVQDVAPEDYFYRIDSKPGVMGSSAVNSGLLGGDKPQRFYHGTRAEFKEFDPDAPYTFVADKPSTAEYYAGDVLDGAPNIRPVYLKDVNFFDVDNPSHMEQLLESDWYAQYGKSLDDAFFDYSEDMNFLDLVEAGDYGTIEDSGLVDWVKSQGFDGFTTYEQDGKNYAVFDVNNIVPGVVKKKEGGVITLADVARNMNRGPRGVGSLAPIARNMYRTMVS